MLSSQDPSMEDLVGTGCTWALVGCAAWLVVVLSAVALDVCRVRAGRRPALATSVGCPTWVVVLVLAGLGLSPGTAWAAPSTPGAPAPHEQPETTLTGLRSPAVPLTSPHPRAHPQPAPRTRVVLPGDSLWSLSADLLGPGASPARLDRTWRRIARLNRDVVGADPDLIHPGDRLLLPPHHHRGEDCP